MGVDLAVLEVLGVDEDDAVDRVDVAPVVQKVPLAQVADGWRGRRNGGGGRRRRREGGRGRRKGGRWRREVGKRKR